MFHRILFRSLQGPTNSMVLECSGGQGSTQKRPTAQLAWSCRMLLGVFTVPFQVPGLSLTLSPYF